jgi:diguanylate cyclase (GGDEF)-like protein/PAS domain S-box-containing protein
VDAQLELLAITQVVFERSPVGLCVADRDGWVTRANGATCRLTLRERHEIVGMKLADLLVPSDRRATGEALAQALAGVREGFEFPVRTQPANGEGAVVRLVLDPVRDDTGAVVCVLARLLPNRDAVGMKRELDLKSSFIEEVARHSPAGIYLRDLDGRFIFNNPWDGVGAWTGLDLSTGRDPHHDEDLDRVRDRHAQIAATREAIVTEWTMSDATTGAPRGYRLVNFPVFDATGDVVAIGGITTESSDATRAERELASTRAFIDAVFAVAPVGMLVTRATSDPSGSVVIGCNDAFAAVTGRSRKELMGTPGDAVVHPDDQGIRRAMIAELLAGGSPVGELRYVRPDGSFTWCVVVPATTFGPEGERLFVVQVLDISDRKEFEGRLRHLADHDGLTDLLSRRRFEEVLREEVARVRRAEAPAALLLLDLDGFKYVNDVLGHSTGDALLRRIGGALRSVVRDIDSLARLGGDEFAALLPATGLDGAIAVAHKLVVAVEEHGRVETEVGSVEVTASVGVSAWDHAVEATAEGLLGEADMAMYDAKEAGKNRVAAFQRGSQIRQSLHRRSVRISRLRSAIAAHRFVLHAQPIVPLAGAEPGPGYVELLIRMAREDGSLVMPGDFLPDAQRHGLIGEIDEWVLGEAIRLVERSESAGSPIAVSVNLAARTVEDPHLIDRIAVLLRDHPIRPERLTLELTETGAISDLGRAGELSEQVRDIGCRLALDDFGAAFATLQYLKHMHFDQLKIDGDFIRDLPHSPSDRMIVKAVADIARGFEADVVAEGVDSAEAVELLKGFGVRYGQGFHLGRPEPIDVS